MLRRLLAVPVLAAAIAAAAPAVVSAASDPTVTFSDGAVRVAGTAAADAFTIAAGDAHHVVIDSSTPFAAADDGVCATLGTEATCEFDYDETAPHAPADVVFDLSGAGADSVDASGRGPAVRSVTVTYAGAPGALTYAGGTPARATVGGESDTLTGVDRVIGTPLADAFTGGPAAETLIGGDGDDAFDVAGAGGPGDAVDCGAGKDLVWLRPGTDAQTGCEVLNGLDTTAPPTLPAPPPGPPALPPLLLPTFQVPTSVAGATIDLTIACPVSCAGALATLLPPLPGPTALPPGWPSVISGTTLQGLLGLLSANQLSSSLDQALTQALAGLQGALDAANGQAQSALQQALIQQARARAEAVLLITQAALGISGLPAGKSTTKLARDVDKAEDKLKTPLNGVKLTTGAGGRAAAAKRPTARALSRWLLIRTARALPTIHTKVTPTSKPGVYRARIAAPIWLRATSRMLRHAGKKTLPVRITLVGTTATLRLPLPR